MRQLELKAVGEEEEEETKETKEDKRRQRKKECYLNMRQLELKAVGEENANNPSSLFYANLYLDGITYWPPLGGKFFVLYIYSAVCEIHEGGWSELYLIKLPFESTWLFCPIVFFGGQWWL